MMSSSWIRASALSPPQVTTSYACASPSGSDRLSSSSESDRSSTSSISISLTTSYSGTFSSSTSSSQSTLHSHVAPPSTSRSSSSWFSYHGGASSAYISDADLFPDALLDECPLLSEAPAPPRQLPIPIPCSPSPAPLRPLYAPEKKQKRGKSPRKHLRPMTKRMSPIVE